MSDVTAKLAKEANDKAVEIARLKAENAKLRELVRAAYNCTNAGPSCLECRVVAGGCTLLSAMRELVRDYERCTMHADCDRCEYDGTTSTHCPLSPCFPDADELRELGVDE